MQLAEVTRKEIRKKAIEELREKRHINFDEFKFLMNYKSSPVRLLNDLNHDNKTALKRYNDYLKLPRLIMEEK